MHMKKYMERKWANFWLFSIMSSGNGMFLIKFKNGGRVSKVVEEGNWMMCGMPLLV